MAEWLELLQEKGERFFQEQVRTLDSSRHLGFWTLMEVVGGWWLWFVAEIGEGNIQTYRENKTKTSKKRKAIEGESDSSDVESVQGHESLHSPLHPLLFDGTQDETQQQLLVHFFFSFIFFLFLNQKKKKQNDKEAEEH